MRFSAWQFFNTLILINVVKEANTLCQNVKGEIKCESVSDISNRVLSEIPGISEVKRLSIQFTPNLTLYVDAFQSTANLEYVGINNNKINNIFSRTFKNLPLKYINLARNGINTILPEAFVNLSSLEKIRVDGNNLERIPVPLFNNLPISELTLSKNKISTIEDKALKDLPNLKRLKLDNNKIESIFIHKIITYPGRLEILWLHNNSLTAVSNYMLQKLSNLNVLNLGFNSIFMIEPNSFEQTPKLNYLILTHNRLKEVDGRIFPRTGMRYLEKLYLDNNKLMFLSSNFFVGLGNLKKITLAGNPWICSCLEDVQKLLGENKITELCNEEYTSGGRPICVSDKPGDHFCRHSYNQELSDKFGNYQISNPLYRPVLSCLL